MAHEEKDKKVTESQEIENKEHSQKSVTPSQEENPKNEDDAKQSPEEEPVEEEVVSEKTEKGAEEHQEADEEEVEDVVLESRTEEESDEEPEVEEVVVAKTAEKESSKKKEPIEEKEEKEVEEVVSEKEIEEDSGEEPEVEEVVVAKTSEKKSSENKESITEKKEEEIDEVVSESPAEEESHDEKESEEKPVEAEVVATKKDVSEEEGSKEEKDTDRHDDDDHEEHHLDYSNYSKTQLVQAIESQLKNTDMSEVGKILKEIKPAFDDIHEAEREDAYQKYLEGGGDKDGFEYKNDELDSRFLEAFNKLRERKSSFFNDLEKQKEQNLSKKQAILEKLREIVDADETVASIKELKEIQEEWKNTGPVAPQHLKSLWANYNALIDRYYDNRSIYFELKELDRKKNLEAKLELCEKAERLEGEDIKEAIKTLNELHDEFKHIGPVPKEDQESVWLRFKGASDAIYARRKLYYDSLKEELKTNQIAKESLAEKVQPFIDFNSEKISDWNQKTKEILDIQREWEAIGGLPREVAKKINKKFWGAFKTFFNHKGQFFKMIEKARQENLKLKEELVEQAESLKESEDFGQTAETLKELQRKWREIGPVPEKFRNDIYFKFKAACDHFFDRKRSSENTQEKDYVENLKKKEAICAELEKMAADDNVDIERIENIVEEYGEIGYVPKHSIKSIQNRYLDAMSAAVEKTDLSEEEKKRVVYTAQYSKLKSSPNSNRIIQKKENTLRRQIAKLENDIDLWKNNITFFAESKTADKLKEEFNEKIEKATEELHNLEEQLKAISSI